MPWVFQADPTVNAFLQIAERYGWAIALIFIFAGEIIPFLQEIFLKKQKQQQETNQLMEKALQLTTQQSETLMRSMQTLQKTTEETHKLIQDFLHLLQTFQENFVSFNELFQKTYMFIAAIERMYSHIVDNNEMMQTQLDLLQKNIREQSEQTQAQFHRIQELNQKIMNDIEKLLKYF